MQSEFQSNLEQLDQKISLRNDMQHASIKLLDYIDYPERVNLDSLIKFISITQIGPTFDPIVNDLVSNGKIQLLKNQNLKEKLSRWTSEIIQVTEEEVLWINLRSERYQPILTELIPLRTVVNAFWENQTLRTFSLDEGQIITFKIGNSKKEFDATKILNDVRFEGIVAQCASFSELINSQSYTLRKRILEILNIIEIEIKL